MIIYLENSVPTLDKIESLNFLVITSADISAGPSYAPNVELGVKRNSIFTTSPVVAPAPAPIVHLSSLYLWYYIFTDQAKIL